MFMEANVVTVTTQLLIRLTNIDINKLLNLWLVQFDGLVAFIGRIGIAKGHILVHSHTCSWKPML